MNIELSDSVKREIRQVVTETVRKHLERNDKVATGLTRSSVSTRVRENKDTFSIQVRANEALQYIIDGRKPQLTSSGEEDVEKRPPISALEAWLEARGLDFDVYALQRSINIEGFEGLGDRFTQDVRREIIEEVTKILVRPQATQAVVDSFLASLKSTIKNVTITR